jgi:predicted ATPase/DNA-binding SARP family transcriptional activator
MRVRVLGAVEVVDDDGNVVALGGIGQRRIIAALAVHAPAPLAIDRLADLCDISPGALRTSVARLRRQMGDATIVTVAGGYALRGVDVDADEFGELIEAARLVDGRRAVQRYAEALQLWHGEALREFAAEEWARPTAVRLDEMRAGAIEDRAECLLEVGDSITAAAEMAAHTAEFPLRDRGRSLLMRALAAQGRATEALREFDSYRRFLLDEVGTEPSGALRELDRRIAAAAPIDPAVRQDGAAPSNLPSSASALIGRERELSQVAAAVTMHPLVTVTGTGGVGKTRLALAVAQHTTWAVDGAWMVELAALRTGGGVPDAVALALGVERRDEESLTRSIAKWCAVNRSLVVLDNCEHVLDEAAAVATAILAAQPRSRLLTTSREPLRVDGEHVVELGPMSLVADEDGESDAVRLFVQRAVDEAPNFDLNSDQASIAEICRRLDGIPLAIELAAARMRSLSPAAVLERLGERFRLLSHGRRTAADRQKTLRAAFDWSYQLLDGEQRNCFDQLSVFSGTFDLDDAVGVLGASAGEWTVVDAVSALVDRSLVARASGRRYRLLETLRSYGEDHCTEAGIVDDVRRAHRRWFSAKSAQMRERAYGRDGVAAIDELVEQLTDYDVAIASALDQDDVACAVDIADNLFHCLLWSRSGQMTGMASIGRLLAALDWDDSNLGLGETLPATTVARGLNFATAWAYAMHSDYPRARRLASQTLAIEPTNSYAFSILAHTAVIAGHVDDAVEPARRALAHAVESSNRFLASLFLGYALVATQQTQAAREVASGLVDWGASVDSVGLMAWARYLLGMIDAREHPERALRSFEASARLAEQAQAPAALNYIQRQRIKLLLGTSTGQARAVLHEVLTRSRLTGDRGNVPVFLAYCVTVLHRLGDDENAAWISDQVEVSALHHDEARQLAETIEKLRSNLGSRFDDVRLESAPHSVNELLDRAITALDASHQASHEIFG